MQIDERALNFIQKAKAAGFSQQEVYDELLAKGYEVGAPREEIQEWKAPEPVQSPYSAMDKVKYTLRAAGEAAPFGMGDLVAGYAATQARNVADITHGKDLKTKLQGAKRFVDYMTPIGQVKMIKEGTFGKERADFIKEQEDFAKHHGGLNFLGEMVGGALTGGVGAAKNVLGKQGIKALMGAGAREGAKFGSIYGAGSGFTQDTDKLSVYDALKGAALGGAGGAVFGAALPPAIALGGKGLKAGSNLVGKFFGTKKAAGREAQKILEQAGGTGVNEVVNADEGVVALKNAIKSDKGLAKEIEQIADEKLINSPDTTKQIISDTLGANDIQAAKDIASAQYREVLASDPIYVPDNIYKNKGLKKAVKNAIKNDYNDELEKKGINSLYGVQAVKEELDDMIAKSMVIGKKGIAEPTKATARLQEVKAKFLENVDAVAPQYKQVREDFEKAIAPYNILGGLLKDQGRERANTIKAILTNKNKTAISDVFGKEKAESLFDALRKQSRLNENYNALYNAAHTELTKSTPIGNKAPWRESVESLGSIVGTVADMARFGGAKRLRRNIAEILLSGQKPSVKVPVKSIPQESGQSISGYLGGKLKEKGGYAWKDLADNATTEKLLKPRDFVSENFVSDVNNSLNNKAVNNYQKIDMGQIPWIYMANGLEEQPLKTNKLSIRKAMGLLTPAELKAHPEWHNHNVPKNVIDKMPELISDPLAIFKSNSETGRYVAVLDAQVKGDPVLAVISPGKDGGYTFMPTAYEKGSFANFVKNTQDLNNVVYVDSKRPSLPHTLLQAVSVGNKDPKHSIATKEGLVKRYFENRKNFLNGSKVVDEKGQPLVVYHGTHHKFNAFDSKKFGSNTGGSVLGEGFYFTDTPKIAEQYAYGFFGSGKGKGNNNVMPVYLFMKNPAMSKKGYNPKIHDGIINKNADGSITYLITNPKQIKSIYNSGTFNRKNPNIYKALIGGVGISQILKNKESK